MARRVVMALNVSTLGYFWFHPPLDDARQSGQYYDRVQDLTSGNEIRAQRGPALRLDFGARKRVLDEAALTGRSSASPFSWTCARTTNGTCTRLPVAAAPWAAAESIGKWSWSGRHPGTKRVDGRSRRASHTPPVERLGSTSGGSRVRDRGRGRGHGRAEGHAVRRRQGRAGGARTAADHPVIGPW